MVVALLIALVPPDLEPVFILGSQRAVSTYKQAIESAPKQPTKLFCP
jgi:hypothetical protein